MSPSFWEKGCTADLLIVKKCPVINNRTTIVSATSSTSPELWKRGVAPDCWAVVFGRNLDSSDSSGRPISGFIINWHRNCHFTQCPIKLQSFNVLPSHPVSSKMLTQPMSSKLPPHPMSPKQPPQPISSKLPPQPMCSKLSSSTNVHQTASTTNVLQTVISTNVLKTATSTNVLQTATSSTILQTLTHFWER